MEAETGHAHLPHGVGELEEYERERERHPRHPAAVLVDQERRDQRRDRQLPRRSGAADRGGGAGVGEQQIPLQLDGADQLAGAAVHEGLGELGAREASRGAARAGAVGPRHAHAVG